MDQQELTKRALEMAMEQIDAVCGCFYVLPTNNQYGEFVVACPSELW